MSSAIGPALQRKLRGRARELARSYSRGHSRAAAPGASHNWCENVAFTHQRFAHPSHLDELRSLVSEASKVRVLGSGHSFSPLCCSEDLLVSLAFMNNVLDVEIASETDMRVHVEGGATLGDVVRYLAPRGLALKNIPSLPHITVAGALATATHGSGVKRGSEAGMPSLCREIDFVTHNGELACYERDDGKTSEQFRAAVVHLGGLGVVSRVSLDVVPAFEVEQRVYEGVDMDALLPAVRELADSVDSLTLGINFGAQKALVWMRYFEREDQRGTPAPALAESFLGGRLRRSPVPFYESQVGVPTTRRGPWHDVPSFFMEGMREVNMPKVALQSEYFVPLSEAGDALQAVREVASRWPGWPASEAWEDLNVRVEVFHCEVRMIPADGLSGMSPFGDRDMCAIHFTWGDWRHRGRILEMVAELEAVLRRFQARPHFGKLNLFSAADVLAAYPEGPVAEYRDLCLRHDPQGKFRNGLLGGQLWCDGQDMAALYP